MCRWNRIEQVQSFSVELVVVVERVAAAAAAAVGLRTVFDCWR